MKLQLELHKNVGVAPKVSQCEKLRLPCVVVTYLSRAPTIEPILHSQKKPVLKKRTGYKIFFAGLLVYRNCINRTHFCARTTVCTKFRINCVDITFRYCINRTFVYACSTRNTFIRNFICHNSVFLN